MVWTIGLVSALAILAISSTPALASDSETETQNWIADCGGTYNLCGFMERDSREQRIPRKFERVLNFSEGLAGVRIDGKYGYIDRAGKLVVAPQFDLVGEFRNGHAEVLFGDHVGIIDSTGAWLLKPEHARAIPFGKTAALVLPGKWSSPYAMGYERLTVESLHSGDGKTFALVDLPSSKTLKSGLHISQFDFDTFVWAKGTGDKGYGLLAPNGSWKLEPRYTGVNQLWRGRALVCISEGEETGRQSVSVQCGSVDENGNQALPMVPYKIVAYSNGIYRFFNETRKVGLLNEVGELIGGRLFDEVNFVEPGTVLEVREGGEWIGLTRQGETVQNPSNDKVLVACPSGVKFLARDGGIEIVKDGKPTTPYVFDNNCPGRECDFPKSVKLKGKYGFIDAHGKLLFDPPFFDNSYSFIQGHAGVLADGKWGIVNTNGHFTVPLQYKYLQPDNEGLYAVKLDDEEFWINNRGERRPEPNRANERRGTLQCGDDGGTVIGKEVGGQMSWGLADIEGRILIEPKYRAISCFEGGLAWVPFDDRRKWCPIDRNEKVRAGVKCVTNWKATRIFDAGPEQMSDDPYESGVLWMRANLDYGLGLRDHPPRIVGNFSTRF